MWNTKGRATRPRRVVYFGILVCLGSALLGCGETSFSFPQCGGDALFFSTRGPSGESVQLICPDGSQPQTFLASTSTHGFFYAQGWSLNAAILVLAEDVPSTPGPFPLHLYLYRPAQRQLTRMTMQDGTEGFGALSPDSKRAVYEFVPNGGAIQTELWVKELTAGQELQLTTQTQPRTDDVFPVWRPDGQEVWFIREVFPPDFSSVTTTLMREGASGGQPSVVLGADQAVDGVAFSASGDRFAARAAQGLEIVDATTLQASIILPQSAFSGMSFNQGTLFWSADRDLLAFVATVPHTNQQEIWTVRPDGTGLKMIHSENALVMYLGGFVQP